MATISFKVQGTTVNNAVIAAYGKRISSQDTVLSVWANAAAIEASKGNLNWATKLFSALTLKNGDLSKQGKSVLAYINRHYPLLTFSKETKTVGRKKQSAESVYNTLFLAPTATESTEGFQLLNGKRYLPLGDFELTYTEFLNLSAPEKEEKEEPSVNVKTFSKQAEKLFTAYDAARLVGSVDEFAKAIADAETLINKLRAAQATLITVNAATDQRVAELTAALPVLPQNMPIDTAMAEQLHKSGQAGKSVRAGSKVAAV